MTLRPLAGGLIPWREGVASQLDSRGVHFDSEQVVYCCEHRYSESKAAMWGMGSMETVAKKLRRSGARVARHQTPVQ
jgi:hypothetical protein